MLSVQMLAGTKDQEINPAHKKSQAPQESPDHCTSTHLPAFDLCPAPTQAKPSWCCFCGVLIAAHWSFVCGDKMQVHVLPARASQAEMPEECGARRGWMQAAEPLGHQFLLPGQRVNSGCAKLTPVPSKTSCMYQRFSGNQAKKD